MNATLGHGGLPAEESVDGIQLIRVRELEGRVIESLFRSAHSESL